MVRRSGVLLFLFVLAVLGLATRPAAAQPKNQVHVLGIDSDEAEDQADALSGAIRSRARAQSGWAVSDQAMSLSMLTAALKCPQRPDSACLGRIGDQLKTDRFIWGLLSKSGKGQVTAEVHLWARGKPDVFAKETFSDNLKDQNDEQLRRIAGRLFDRLVLGQGAGTLVVKAGDAGGVVLVDGAEKAQLEHGQATLDLKPGAYTLEVKVPGFLPAKQSVTVTAGAESTLALTLTPEAATQGAKTPAPSAATQPDEGGGGGSARKAFGWGLVVVGVVAAGVGVYELAHFLSLSSQNKDFRNANMIQLANGTRDVPDKATICSAANGPPALPSGATWANGSAPSTSDADAACNRYSQASTASTVGWIAGGVGVLSIGVGAYLLVTDGKGNEPVKVTTGKRGPRSEPSLLSRLRVAPAWAPGGGSLHLALTF